MNKKIAPYGSFLAQQESAYNIVIIFMGSKSWQRAKSFQLQVPFTLCLPPKASPSTYVWPVCGCDVYLIDTDISNLSLIRDFALLLISYGANIVNYFSPSQVVPITFVKGL